MSTVKKYFIIIFLILLVFLQAEEGILSSNLDPELKPENTTTNLDMLNFIPTEDINISPYSFFLEEQYVPGSTITFNVKITTSNQNIKAAVLAFDQKYELKEFFENNWQTLIPVPKNISPGKYKFKLFIKGIPGLDVAEVIPVEIDNFLAKVNIQGLKHVSENEVQEAINIKPGDFYSDLKAEVSRQKIMDLGYFQKVSYNLQIVAGRPELTFYIIENPVINKFDVVGAVEFSKEELLNNFSSKEGEVLSYKKLQKDILKLENFYKDKDYTFSKVIGVEEPSFGNDFTLIFKVNEGRLNNISITGNTVTQEYVIRREMEMRPGEVFSATTLREDLRKIYNLNYFQNVEPEVFFNDNTNQVDVTVNVKEKKTSSINLGGGYGQIQGWFGFVDLFLDNIYGTAQSVLLKAQFGQYLTSYQLRYHNPWMWPNRTSFTGKLWSTYGNNYLTWERELRNGWSMAVGFQRSVYVSETYSFKYEDVFNTDDHSKNYLDRALGYTIAYDSRDQWMNPTKGSYDVFSMEHSSSFLGGTIDASRYSIQVNRFLPIAEKQVLAGRFMYNYAIGDIFATEQYYIGGNSGENIRGYSEVIAKGLQRCFFNFEYRYIFSDMITGLIFYDIGQAINPVFDSSDEENDFTNHHGWASSIGFGLRIITPIGPIRLDYGWPQYKEFSDGFLVFNIGQNF